MRFEIQNSGAIIYQAKQVILENWTLHLASQRAKLIILMTQMQAKGRRGQDWKSEVTGSNA